MRTDVNSRIIGVGLDIIDIRRLANALERGAGTFRGHVFTEAEWEECAKRRNPVRALAQRFAVKEAFLKALGTGWAERITLVEVSLAEDLVTRNHRVLLTGEAAKRAEQMGVASIHVTISHLGTEAAAIVVITS
jgi:holo-[acyl-carrier protein] synthase